MPISDLRDMVWGKQQNDNYNIYQCSLSIYQAKLYLHSVVSKCIILKVRKTIFCQAETGSSGSCLVWQDRQNLLFFLDTAEPTKTVKISCISVINNICICYTWSSLIILSSANTLPFPFELLQMFANSMQPAAAF